MGFPGGTVVKNPSVNTGDSGEAGLIPGSIRSPGFEKRILLLKKTACHLQKKSMLGTETYPCACPRKEK